MKKILGLDLGTTSIGWALVNEAEHEHEESSIIKVGVRVNPLTANEKKDFNTGKAITTNAKRTERRSARRNLQRYKLRRESLKNLLQELEWISSETVLTEQGKDSTFSTLKLRAKAVSEQITLEELSKVLLMINKKRGYKSNRKTNKGEEGQLIDGMNIAKEMEEKGITPGQYAYNLMRLGNYNIPDFYRSDLYSEFDKIWEFQAQSHPEMTDELKSAIRGKNENLTWTRCQAPFNLVGIKRTTKGKDLKKETMEWRAKAVSEAIDYERLIIVFQAINKNINASSEYLGKISDRSKELTFKNLTIGQHIIEALDRNPHYSLANQVFYRQDYIDEFDRIWQTQSSFYPQLTQELKKRIKNEIIFYQRPLKSQKNLISLCEFENHEISIEKDGKTLTKQSV